MNVLPDLKNSGLHGRFPVLEWDCQLCHWGVILKTPLHSPPSAVGIRKTRHVPFPQWNDMNGQT